MKRFISIILTVLIAVSPVYAHSGRTDANGGHRDKNNVSGLGPYHYHCGGHPAHLHINGVCPYDSTISAPSAPSYSGYTYTKPVTPAPDPNRNNIYIMHCAPQMSVGESFKADAVSNNTSAGITWSSSDDSVACVDPVTGVVTAKGIGSAIITASNGYKSQSYTVTCKGYISYTDTKAEINGYPIQTYKYGNDIYVSCNDLNSYGFKASFSSDEAGSRVDIDKGDDAVLPKETVSYPDGKIAYEAVPTSIQVICGLNNAKCVNGGGNMFVAFEELSALGEVHHSEPENKYTFTTSEDTILTSEYTQTYYN